MSCTLAPSTEHALKVLIDDVLLANLRHAEREPLLAI